MVDFYLARAQHLVAEHAELFCERTSEWERLALAARILVSAPRREPGTRRSRQLALPLPRARPARVHRM